MGTFCAFVGLFILLSIWFTGRVISGGIDFPQPEDTVEGLREQLQRERDYYSLEIARLQHELAEEKTKNARKRR